MSTDSDTANSEIILRNMSRTDEQHIIDELTDAGIKRDVIRCERD